MLSARNVVVVVVVVVIVVVVVRTAFEATNYLGLKRKNFPPRRSSRKRQENGRGRLEWRAQKPGIADNSWTNVLHVELRRVGNVSASHFTGRIAPTTHMSSLWQRTSNMRSPRAWSMEHGYVHTTRRQFMCASDDRLGTSG
jgi:hypothetical protein